MVEALDWARLGREARNLAYNNNAAVPEADRLIQERNVSAAAWRSAHPQALDLPYGPGERNRWDLFPARDPAAPCLVFIHGGYWQRNRREDFAGLAEGLAAHGWSVALPGYPLAPEASLARIVVELGQALDWLAGPGREHGIAGPVVLSGWSAGGHLAALLLDHAAVSAGLAISGIYELGPLRDTYLDDLLSLTEEEVATLSPLRLAASAKPLAIAYGTRELPALVRDSRDLHGRRAAAHAPGPLIPVAGADHFTILDSLRSPTGLLTRAALALVS